MSYMQREPKKTKLPVKTDKKAGKPTSSKVSKQENSVASKKKPAIVADKIKKKSKVAGINALATDKMSW